MNIVDELNEVITILRQIPAPDDMEVSEWNTTPVGHAINRLNDLIEAIEETAD